MLRDKPLSHLILILFTTMIGANIVGEMLRFILIALVGPDTIVRTRPLALRGVFHWAAHVQSRHPVLFV